jgi:uncharacterized protein
LLFVEPLVLLCGQTLKTQLIQESVDLKRNSYNCRITLCISGANIKKISDMNRTLSESFKECYGTWALVAGAAEGIGEAFTLALAKKGMNLVMVDIKPDSLSELSSRLQEKYLITTKQIVKDLSDPDAAVVCMNLIRDLDCRLLVYVPAYSPVKRFLDNSQEELDRYINLNSRTPLHFVHLFTAHLRKLKGGGMLLMSSLAGLIGPQFSAPYAATKAFNIVLAESLFHELKRDGISIMACCAGTTSTPTFWSSNPTLNRWVRLMKPETLAVNAIKKMGMKSIYIPGWQNRLSYFLLTRILPRRMAALIVSKEMERIFPKIIP